MPPACRMQVDLVVMTGNVALVFLSDVEWSDTLAGTRNALRAGGYFVLETRRPESCAWESWRRDRAEVEAALTRAGYPTLEVREAPDRPRRGIRLYRRARPLIVWATPLSDPQKRPPWHD